MKHVCHAAACSIEVPPRMLMCRAHWALVPQDVQRAVWREYREGQEDDKKPSLAYLAVQRLAVMLVAQREGRYAESSTAGLEAELYRSKARAGGPDPFRGTAAD